MVYISSQLFYYFLYIHLTFCIFLKFESNLEISCSFIPKYLQCVFPKEMVLSNINGVQLSQSDLTAVYYCLIQTPHSVLFNGPNNVLSGIFSRKEKIFFQRRILLRIIYYMQLSNLFSLNVEEFLSFLCLCDVRVFEVIRTLWNVPDH